MVERLILELLSLNYLRRLQSSTSPFRTMVIQEERTASVREEVVETIEIMTVIRGREIGKITIKEMTSMTSTIDKVEEMLRSRAVVKGLSILKVRKTHLEVKNSQVEEVESQARRRGSIKAITLLIKRQATATMTSKTL